MRFSEFVKSYETLILGIFGVSLNKTVSHVCQDESIPTKKEVTMTYSKKYRDIVAAATPGQIEQAVTWYLDAELIANDLVRIFANRGMDVSLESCASVISSFSPRQRWSRNVVQAVEFANGGKPAGLSNNLLMAENSLTMGFDALKGLKTNAFAKAIAGDENAVTIDVWMCKAAGLETNAPNKTQYRELSEAVNVVATELRMSPRATQALIWIIFRGGAE